MSVTQCPFPSDSGLDRRMVDAVYFTDSYRAPLRDSSASMTDIFFDLFGHHPTWAKSILLVRNRIVALFGLDVPNDEDILDPKRKERYAVGDTIGPWPIFALTDDELIAGRDNRHLDFRLSLLRQGHGDMSTVTVSTICDVHNVGGKIYLFFIVPFHKWGVKQLILRAIKAGRL
ncbi:MAG: DUF2867 domain-containing protein [Sphingomonadaceae bacterium]